MAKGRVMTSLVTHIKAGDLVHGYLAITRIDTYVELEHFLSHDHMIIAGDKALSCEFVLNWSFRILTKALRSGQLWTTASKNIKPFYKKKRSITWKRQR